MKLTRSLKLAFNMLIHSKLRSWLTIIGVVIGVAAVVIIISAGSGAQATLQSQLTQFGSDYVTVNAKGSMGPVGPGSGPVSGKLTDKDLQALRGTPGVEAMTGMINDKAEVTYAGQTRLLQIAGMKSSVWAEFSKNEVAIGRNLKDTDLKEVILGKNIAEEAYEREITLNQVVQIDGKNFRVVGINDFSGMTSSMNNFLMMNLEPAKDILFSPDEEVEYGEIDLITNKNPNVVAEEVERRLLLSRHETEDDKTFIVMTPDDILDQVNEIMSMITMFLGAIAVISLIVGAVGIMNTMFTSVLEKTKEIGIMKSVGARNKDIVIIFLLKAAMVGLVGGALGCLIGIGITYGITVAINAYGIPFELVISPWFVLVALTLAAAIGMLAGVIPAWRASKLNPVDALRYE